jgi:alanyl-tRNA synthetase
MKANEIRSRFLEYFGERGHVVVPSGPLIPGDDPTLLFTNAGMVQFKRVFLGLDSVPYRRAVTAQKCVRAGGKHNDLEQVGVTARHQTFFEMLGNFSFGDYFKADAIAFAWEFLTEELALDSSRLFVTVHHSDDEAFDLWKGVAGLGEERLFRLGDAENFWQMADTGPCGPCSELHYDMRGEESRGGVESADAFEALSARGRIVELWNLVFMQYDREEDGTLNPLPAPSIDTGAGLERLAAVLQGVDTNYGTDLFVPLLDRVAAEVGEPYDPSGSRGIGYRVLADHARAVAFLLADGVMPSNEGRGYVLRRILRRAVRHAWLLGVDRPLLVHVVDEVIATMGQAYPELGGRRDAILEATRREESRFLDTIEGGMARFDELAPERAGEYAGIISGEEAFRLYDTFGFPLDLTQVMAGERGYEVDEEGFAAALDRQRVRSREDRAEVSRSRAGDTLEASSHEAWNTFAPFDEQRWIGWESREGKTRVLGFLEANGRLGVVLAENPFYSEAGGQVADRGAVEGDGWSVAVDHVWRVGPATAVGGRLTGALPDGGAQPWPVVARVDTRARHDAERNHTATHLLHSALRRVLGEHVTQRGSLVSPDRLRFDFSHDAPMTKDQVVEVEALVNDAIWKDYPVRWEVMSKEEASARGAMALFGEKYGDEVRVVEVPGVSVELCGGCHLRHTAEAGLFVIVRESGVAAGVRRVEALTGPAAFEYLRSYEREVDTLAGMLKADRSQVVKRVEEVLRERDEVESLLRELREGGGGGEEQVFESELSTRDGGTVRYQAFRMKVRDPDDARAFGDGFRGEESSSVAVLAAESLDGKISLFAFVTDDLIHRGLKAGALIREVAAVTGGRGGGKAHMAQGGVGDSSKVDEALRVGENVVREMMSGVVS